MPETSHQLISSDNVLLRAGGTNKGPLLFCIPGFACAGTDYLALLDSPLAQRFRIVIIDLPGFGASPSREDLKLISDYATFVVTLIQKLYEGHPVILMAHSLGSTIAVEALHRLDLPRALISIEGNLLDIDAYASGQAAKYEDPQLFKHNFLNSLWQRSSDIPIFKRFYSSAFQADATKMWQLGRDAVAIGSSDTFGRRMLALENPLLYCWSEATTPVETAKWLRENSLPDHQYTVATHWPMVDAVEELSAAVMEFWDSLDL